MPQLDHSHGQRAARHILGRPDVGCTAPLGYVELKAFADGLDGKSNSELMTCLGTAPV